MLHVITQKNLASDKDILAQAFQRREFEFPLLQEEIKPFSKLPQAVYFVGVDERAGVCGLARLLPTTGCHIDATFVPNDKCQPWELSAIHFFLPTDMGFLRSESLIADLANRFYYELFESLYHFSCQEKIQRILVLDNFAILQDLACVGWPLKQVERRQAYLPSPLSSCPLEISSKSFQEFCNGQGVELNQNLQMI